MVTASNDILAAESDGMATRPGGNLAARLAGGLVLWLRGARTHQALMRLSDRALADIGTTRDELGTFARQSDPWRQLPKDAALVLALGAMIERLEGWRNRRRQEAKVYRELMAYSDQELTDLGISRRDIKTIARGDASVTAA